MNGFLIIDKEEGKTSRDIDNDIMYKFATKKVGHLGTLDPLATGVLVLALGNALKVLSLIEKHDKTYVAQVKMGISTDTLDITGRTILTSQARASKDAVIKVLDSFLGENLFPVPKYSAVKVAGKKLYEYARNNEEVELPKKLMTVYSYKILSFNEDEFVFEIKTSYGTYIRTIIDELGKKLNVPMTMSSLRRTQSGIFNIEDAVNQHQASLDNLIPIEAVLKDFYTVVADEKLIERISHGQILKDIYKKYPIIFTDKNKEIIAIYKQYDKDNNYVKPHKIISKS